MHQILETQNKFNNKNNCRHILFATKRMSKLNIDCRNLYYRKMQLFINNYVESLYQAAVFIDAELVVSRG